MLINDDLFVDRGKIIVRPEQTSPISLYLNLFIGFQRIRFELSFPWFDVRTELFCIFFMNYEFDFRVEFGSEIEQFITLPHVHVKSFNNVSVKPVFSQNRLGFFLYTNHYQVP